MRSLTLSLSIVLAAALVSGCALTAHKVPTPAAKITSEELAQLPKPPDERYFLIFFGSNDLLRLPQYTHTWATLVRMRAEDAGPCCGSCIPGCVDPLLDVHTISWLPEKVKIDTRNYTVEPGRNFDLHETMRIAYDTKQSVAVWGPYEVWHGFAHRFLVQKRFLESGMVGYQCVDMRGEAGRLGNGCNCFHSITDMDPIYPRWRYPLAFYGKPATGNLVWRFMHSPIWIEPRETHDWLLPRLGLDAYPIHKRKYFGFAHHHKPDSPTDLDARARALPGAQPKPKELTPKTAPGIESGQKPTLEPLAPLESR